MNPGDKWSISRTASQVRDAFCRQILTQLVSLYGCWLQLTLVWSVSLHMSVTKSHPESRSKQGVLQGAKRQGQGCLKNERRSRPTFQEQTSYLQAHPFHRIRAAEAENIRRSPTESSDPLPTETFGCRRKRHVPAWVTPTGEGLVLHGHSSINHTLMCIYIYIYIW